MARTDGAMQAMLQSLQGVLMEGWEGGGEEFGPFLFLGILEKQLQVLFGICVYAGEAGDRTRTCFPFCKALLVSVSLAGLTHHIGPGSLSGLLTPVTCALAFLFFGSICPCSPGLLQTLSGSYTLSLSPRLGGLGVLQGEIEKERPACWVLCLFLPSLPIL